MHQIECRRETISDGVILIATYSLRFDINHHVLRFERLEILRYYQSSIETEVSLKISISRHVVAVNTLSKILIPLSGKLNVKILSPSASSGSLVMITAEGMFSSFFQKISVTSILLTTTHHKHLRPTVKMDDCYLTDQGANGVMSGPSFGHPFG